MEPAAPVETVVATPLEEKSPVAQIRERFEQDVERFANLDTGQSATIDAPLVMQLMTQAAAASTPEIRQVLDLGCGAGNNTLKLLEVAGPFDCHLVDLSGAMLERARQRVGAATSGEVVTFEGDLRSVELGDGAYDVVLAAAVLHHLRGDADWEAVFCRLYRWLAPSGSVWISDLVAHETWPVQDLLWRRYGDYLVALGGQEHRDRVFSYVDQEDSPRPVTYQLDLLRRVGFAKVELLHKNGCFAAFGAIKGSSRGSEREAR